MTDHAEKPDHPYVVPTDDIMMPDSMIDTGPSVDAAVTAKVAELEKKLAEANDKMLRALAETENTRRRLEKERIDTSKYAVSSFAKDMLNVADNLRRALAAMTPEAREKSPEIKNLAVGVEATERELLGIFERNGIKRVDPINQMFDPNLHEVIFEGDAPDKEPGTVIQVVEAGFTIHDRLLRPARVGLAKGGAESASTIDQEV